MHPAGGNGKPQRRQAWGSPSVRPSGSVVRVLMTGRKMSARKPYLTSQQRMSAWNMVILPAMQGCRAKTAHCR